MIALAWHMVRARTSALAGTFIALGLGVALLSAVALTLVATVGSGGGGPRWYTEPDVVVTGANTVSVVTRDSDGEEETETERTPGWRELPADLAGRLDDATGAETTVDYAGYAVVAGVDGDTVHPWSAAALHPYTWVAGGAPRAAGELVLSAPTAHRPGDRIAVHTARGTEEFTVSGVLDTDAPAALYAGDEEAADLAAGRVHALAMTAPAGVTAADLADRVRAVVDNGATDADGDAVQVLTGDDRRRAEPDPDGQRRTAAISLLGVTSGLAAFVSVFVVSGTFAYAVAARRQEFGLLRAAGATPRQVRRLVLGEALVVGTLASLAGAALGTALAPALAHWLVASDFAPGGFTAHFVFWPVAAAIGLGLLVALTGAALASGRAGRVRPVEALREASVDRRAMTVPRWLAGLAALGGAVPMLALFPGAAPDDAVALVLLSGMFLVLAVAMFAPLLVPTLVRLITLPLAASLGATGLLIRHGARAAVRRVAATVAPILVTVGIAGSMLAGFGTFKEAARSAAHDRVTAEAIAVSEEGAGLADATVAALAAEPGVTAAVPVTDTPVYVRDDGQPEEWTGRYAHGPDLAEVLDLPLADGDLADLTGDDTIAVPAGHWKLGERAELWLGDAAPVRLRVVAVLADQLDLADVVLLPRALRAAHAQPLADSVYLALAPDGSRTAVAAAVETAGGSVIRTEDHLLAADEEQDRTDRLAIICVLGLALLYTGISIANTLAMTIGDRAREFAALRLTGATGRQILRMVGVEAAVVTCTGVLLAAAVTATTVLLTRTGIGDRAPSVPVVVPWQPLGAIAAACLLTALLAGLIPAALLLRRRPAELAATRE